MTVTEPLPEPVATDAAGVAPLVETAGQRRSRLLLAAGLGTMAALHFVLPRPFDAIIPRWVPGRARTWTYASGAAELASAALLASERTRRIGAWAAAATIVGVYPANVQMAIDNAPSTAFGIGVWLRLPLQVPLVAWALRIARR